MWLNIPAAVEPKADASIARLATIPHGNAFCTIGFVEQAVFEGVPEIPPANVVPFEIGGRPPATGTSNPYSEYDLGTETTFRTSPLAAGITQALVNDPNQMLRDTLNHQVHGLGYTLKSITRLITAAASDIANIPFITSNADTPSLQSVFAIETVVDKTGHEFMQLQYSQTALLNFRGHSYPHATVGTLTKAF